MPDVTREKIFSAAKKNDLSKMEQVLDKSIKIETLNRIITMVIKKAIKP
jgi:hypothetical protein